MVHILQHFKLNINMNLSKLAIYTNLININEYNNI